MRPAALMGVIFAACSVTPPPAPSPIARCPKTLRSADLDARLVVARHRILPCVGEEAARGRLAQAHRCYRALRLLESARWWLRSLGEGELDELNRVYQPAEPRRQEFLCHIAHLARARTPLEVERRYMALIRAYP